MGKKKKKISLKRALISCKGKKGEKWDECLAKHGIKKKK
ncbi:hypothetical protein ES703_31245 [subsurface metagenome]